MKLHSGETHSWRGEQGGAAAGGPCLDGEAALRKAFFVTASPPRRLPPRIALSVRISKAAPGLFRSGNLILLRVYFSTLENSQRRTRSRAAPSLLTPPPSPFCPGGGARGGPRRSSLRGAAPASSRICGARDSDWGPEDAAGGAGPRRGGAR